MFFNFFVLKMIKVTTRNLAQNTIPIRDILPVSDYIFVQELSESWYEILKQKSPHQHSYFVPVRDEAIDYGKWGISQNSHVFGLGYFGCEKPKNTIFSLPIVLGLDRRPRLCVKTSFISIGTVVHVHMSKYESSREKSRPIIKKIATDCMIVWDLNMDKSECFDRLGKKWMTSYDISPYISHLPTWKTLDYICIPKDKKISTTKTIVHELSDHAAVQWRLSQ